MDLTAQQQIEYARREEQRARELAEQVRLERIEAARREHEQAEALKQAQVPAEASGCDGWIFFPVVADRRVG